MTPTRLLPALAALTIAAGPVAWSAETPAEPAADAAEERPDIDDATLGRLARAYVAVNEIEAEYAKRLARITDLEKERRLEEEQAREIDEAVSEQGFDVERYREMLDRVQAQPELRRHFAQLIVDYRKEHR